MAIDLGTAYIQIQPSTKGLIPALKKELGGFESVAKNAGEAGGDEISKGLGSRIKGGMPKLGGVLKAGLIGLAAGVGLAVGKTIMDGISGAAELEQSRGGLATVFEKDTKLMNKQAEDAAKNLGMSEDQYNKMATASGAFFKGQQMDAAKYTTDLIKRGSDVSATFGGSTEEAVAAMNSGMRGSYEPLEKYGIVMNEAMVNQELVARGQDKLTGANLEQAKAQARYDIIMKKSADSQGAFAKESGTMANQQQVMAAQWENLQAKIGEGFLPVITTVMTFVNDTVIPGIESFVGGISSGEGPLAGLQSILQGVSTVFMEQVVPALSSAYEWIQTKLMPIISEFGERIVKPIFEGIIMPALTSFWEFLKNYVGPSIGWLFEEVIGPTFSKIGDVIQLFGDNWASIWTGIQKAAAAPINFIIGTVWNDGLRKVLNWVFGVFGGKAIPPAALISIPEAAGKPGSRSTSSKGISAFARGGILPGWSRASQGDDQLIMARKGEGITVSEALDPYEKQRLLALNQAALKGIPAKSFREQFDGHATGGIVGFRGHKFTDTFVETLKAAESLAKTTFRISQGGFRPRTSYSGTSHQGDAVDLTPVTTNNVRALRMAGVAAWDRTGKGDWNPHIHGVPLPGYGRGAGSAIWQAQEYLRGRDGLGGRDNGPKVGVNRAATSLGEYTDDGGNLLELIPKVWKSAADGLKELTGPWGDVLKSAMTDVLSKAFDWTVEKVPGLKQIMDLFGNRVGKITTDENRVGPPNMRGYATGTSSAARGPAWVGENGPEIVNFRGGEQVYTAEQSAAMTSPVHIENVNLPGVKTFNDLIEFAESLSSARRHGHMTGAVYG